MKVTNTHHNKQNYLCCNLLKIATKYPKAIKAPGASTKSVIPKSSGKKETENILPDPRNSRAIPNAVSANVKPKPIPTPSKSEEITLFFAANASALPNTIQFTTMRGIKIPKLSAKAGKYAFITISTMVTKVAITTIKAGIRTKSGIKFFNSEITMFEHIRTNIVANPMLMPLIAELVVASVGHIPSKRTNTGLSLIIPLINILIFLFIV